MLIYVCLYENEQKHTHFSFFLKQKTQKCMTFVKIKNQYIAHFLLQKKVTITF